MGDINVKDKPDRVVSVNELIFEEIGMTIGSVVTLKSGGPKMTVTHVSADDSVSCFWFDTNHISHHQTYPAAALQAQNEPSK